MRQQLTSVECPTCQTLFHGVEVEDGHAALEARPCADAACGKLLCQLCAVFYCGGCAGMFCQSHMVTIPDGTEKPLQCCAACAAECEVQHCPACDSVNVYTDYVEFGEDAATGYHDAAAIFSCRACGVRGEAEELVYRPAIARPVLVERKPVAAEVASAAGSAKSA